MGCTSGGHRSPRDHAPTQGETGSVHRSVQCGGQGQVKIEVQGSGATGISGSGLVPSRRLQALCDPRSWAEPSKTGAHGLPALSSRALPCPALLRNVRSCQHMGQVGGGGVCAWPAAEPWDSPSGLALFPDPCPVPRPLSCSRTPALNHCLLGCILKSPRPRSAAQPLACGLTVGQHS